MAVIPELGAGGGGERGQEDQKFKVTLATLRIVDLKTSLG